MPSFQRMFFSKIIYDLQEFIVKLEKEIESCEPSEQETYYSNFLVNEIKKMNFGGIDKDSTVRLQVQLTKIMISLSVKLQIETLKFNIKRFEKLLKSHVTDFEKRRAAIQEDFVSKNEKEISAVNGVLNENAKIFGICPEALTKEIKTRLKRMINSFIEQYEEGKLSKTQIIEEIRNFKIPGIKAQHLSIIIDKMLEIVESFDESENFTENLNDLSESYN